MDRLNRALTMRGFEQDGKMVDYLNWSVQVPFITGLVILRLYALAPHCLGLKRDVNSLLVSLDFDHPPRKHLCGAHRSCAAHSHLTTTTTSNTIKTRRKWP
jgi:hypothetical protein